ncbi:MAG: hypothetical protein WCK42_06690, partial [Myxococcaceae bacterium]
MRFASITLICFIFWSSCASHKKTINHIGDSYDKAMFNPNWETSLLSPEWYYRMTVVDTAPGSKALSIGDGHWLHPETIRFEITYDLLIGWRSQPTVPGSEAENSNYRGAPVVAFKITSHFDAARNYDPMTSAKGNLLIENVTDHGWDKRRFIKVDFSKNLVEELKRKDEGIVEMDNAFAVGKNDPSNPKRCRFEDGYFELTTRQGVQVDIYKYYGLNGEAFKMDASAPVIDLRFSFLRKPEKTSYQPLNYTDNLFDKFGFYRVAFTGQQQWDPFRGILESQKNYNITRFNIWNEDGSPKPIVYYTSVSHPKNLMNASRRVESEWNKIFKELVLEMKKDNYKNISEVPDMWVLKENSCNWKNVYKQLSDDLRKKVEASSQVTMIDIKSRLDHANDLNNANSFTQNTVEEAKALDDLEKICSALEFFTQGTENAFKYQRSGDLRYNLLNLINKYALTDWSGLGPMFADKETGEIIQSQANVNLWYLDRRTQQVVDMINLMTGKIRFKELILGGDVQSYMNQKLTQIRQQELLLPETHALLKIQNRLEGQREDTVSEADISARLHLIDSSMIFSKIGNEDGVIDYVLEQQARIYKQSQNIADPPEFLDNLIVGMALQYKDTDPKIRFLKIRESVYTAVALHEVGHNTGLTHNMAGSADPVNYGAQFWKIQALPPDIFEAIKASRNDFEIQKALVACWNDSTRILRSEAKSQDCFRQQELMYSSIMDYQTSWNADLGGLGPYDKAAIFFGYGQLVQVFPEKNLLKTPKEKGLARWLFLNDWRKIPTQLVDSHQKINERQWV